MKRVDRREASLVSLILLSALVLRMWGVRYDLPYIYHTDEPTYVAISQTIFQSGDLNPHFFNYPSLFFYLNALAYLPYYLAGKAMGVFVARSDLMPPVTLTMGVTYTPMPAAIVLGRMVSVLFGVGAVAVTYAVGKHLTGQMFVGGLAAAMLAVSPTAVAHSRFITPDVFVLFFTVAAFWAAVWVYRQGSVWQYAAAGLCAGLAASSKYNGALIVLAVAAAHFLRPGGLRDHRLYLALILCGVGFFAVTPFALLDAPTFLADLRFEAEHYITGHAGMEGDTFRWYIRYMGATAGVIAVLAGLELLRGLVTRSKATLLLAVFPLAYFALISLMVVRNDRMFLPLIPFLCLLAASFIAHWRRRIRALPHDATRAMAGLALGTLTVVSLAAPAARTAEATLRLTGADSRETARVWITDHLPAGSKIALEAYAPFVEPARYVVQGVGRMIDHPPEWYVAQGFDYLIFSGGMYGRFYHDPERYPTEVAHYDRLFERFTRLQTFDGPGNEIRIYAVR